MENLILLLARFAGLGLITVLAIVAVVQVLAACDLRRFDGLRTDLAQLGGVIAVLALVVGWTFQ